MVADRSNAVGQVNAGQIVAIAELIIGNRIIIIPERIVANRSDRIAIQLSGNFQMFHCAGVPYDLRGTILEQDVFIVPGRISALFLGLLSQGIGTEAKQKRNQS